MPEFLPFNTHSTQITNKIHTQSSQFQFFGQFGSPWIDFSAVWYFPLPLHTLSHSRDVLHRKKSVCPNAHLLNQICRTPWQAPYKSNLEDAVFLEVLLCHLNLQMFSRFPPFSSSANAYLRSISPVPWEVFLRLPGKDFSDLLIKDECLPTSPVPELQRDSSQNFSYVSMHIHQRRIATGSFHCQSNRKTNSWIF